MIIQSLAAELNQIISLYYEKLSLMSETDFQFRYSPEKWSKKEFLGHLIDSAQNNIRRFIVSQYESSPKIIYDQEAWVRICAYSREDYPVKDLIQFWRLLNLHIVAILSNLGVDDSLKKCMTNGPEPLTVYWLAADYIKHLKHHLHQILDLQQVPYP